MAQNNLVELTGNLGQEPEVLNPGTEKEFVKLTLATTDSYKDDDGWKNKGSVWHTVLAFGPTVKGYARSYKRGDRVKITGSLSYRQTTVQVDGQKRIFREVAVVASRIEDARLPKKGAA